MKKFQKGLTITVAAAIVAGAFFTNATAQTVIDEWGSAKLPPPPALKAATLAPAETALLVMDFTNQTCSTQRRPRCAASVPKVHKLVVGARAKGALVIYSVAVPGSTAADILKELAPATGELVLPPLGPDKFINSDLEKILKGKGIKTVVALGTQAQTSVLHTGAAAALRGFKVIVPVDGMSSDDVFPELYTAWHLANAARISAQVTLTRLDMIGY
ncbi:MAG: cysteine hydrolase [Betaproteobacteria bacterium]|nr:MAG: cysteine hydrolase [Betaproteobacteria bacterium]